MTRSPSAALNQANERLPLPRGARPLPRMEGPPQRAVERGDGQVEARARRTRRTRAHLRHDLDSPSPAREERSEIAGRREDATQGRRFDGQVEQSSIVRRRGPLVGQKTSQDGVHCPRPSTNLAQNHAKARGRLHASASTAAEPGGHPFPGEGSGRVQGALVMGPSRGAARAPRPPPRPEPPEPASPGAHPPLVQEPPGSAGICDTWQEESLC